MDEYNPYNDTERLLLSSGCVAKNIASDPRVALAKLKLAEEALSRLKEYLERKC